MLVTLENLVACPVGATIRFTSAQFIHCYRKVAPGCWRQVRAYGEVYGPGHSTDFLWNWMTSATHKIEFVAGP